MGGGGSSSSSTSRATTTRSPPYYTTPRPLLTTSPGQRYRTTTTIRQPILVPAGGSSSDNNQIPDTNQKGGRLPPVLVPPAAPQPPVLPTVDFCSPRVTADISWPRTQQGQTAKQPCPVGTLGMKLLDGIHGVKNTTSYSVICLVIKKKKRKDMRVLCKNAVCLLSTKNICIFLKTLKLIC